MTTDLKEISALIEFQFPAFYREDGENFVQFVRAYYEWMDQLGPIYDSRRLLETSDIDETSEEFISHFINKYMRGIPTTILSDRRLLEKHILDVYRSKGSIEGLKLLFRLLYNSEIEVYVPQQDMLRTSDGKWVRKTYLEVENKQSNYTFAEKFITGVTSGATAYVDEVLDAYIGNTKITMFYLTDIVGNPQTGQLFQIGEKLTYDGFDPFLQPFVLGSVLSADVNGSTENHALGDTLISNSISGEGLSFYVSTLRDALSQRGFLTFKILDGGDGFTLDSVVTFKYGTATTGTGASFKVGSLTDTSTFTYNVDLLSTKLSTSLAALDYGFSAPASISTIINAALVNGTTTVGKIASLKSVTSGDKNYNGTVIPNVYESKTYGYGIVATNGGFWGNNAVISGTLSTGNGVIQSVILRSSGMGYNTEGEIVDFLNESNTNLTAELTLHVGASGQDEGRWINEDGFLSSSKFLQDGYYYQEYSYEIQFEKSLDKYIDVLKQVMHPIGNQIFGKTLIADDIVLDSLSISHENQQLFYS